MAERSNNSYNLDFAYNPQSKTKAELEVMSKIKALNTLIFEITQKSPKQFRFSLVSRMQNLSLDLLEAIYRVNDTYIDMRIIKDMNKSIEHAKRAGAADGDGELKLFFMNKQFRLKLARADKLQERVEKRLDFSQSAMTDLKLLDYLVTLSESCGCITSRQRERLVRAMYEVRMLLGAYIKSDRRRFGG